MECSSEGDGSGTTEVPGEPQSLHWADTDVREGVSEDGIFGNRVWVAPHLEVQSGPEVELAKVTDLDMPSCPAACSSSSSIQPQQLTAASARGSDGGAQRHPGLEATEGGQSLCQVSGVQGYPTTDVEKAHFLDVLSTWELEVEVVFVGVAGKKALKKKAALLRKAEFMRAALVDGACDF